MDSNEWVGIVNTIAPKYTKGAVDLTKRNQLWLKLLDKMGRIVYGGSGTTVFWEVQHLNQPVQGYADGQGNTFERHNIYRPCNLEWRGYKATDLMTEKEKLQYSDDVGIINRYKTTMKTLTKSVLRVLNLSIYVDGNAAGNELFFHGIPSFTGVGTCAAGDLVAVCSDTYAGNSTAQGQFGLWSQDRAGQSQGVGTGYPNSTLATDWPEGYGDTGYDFFSPILLNWSSTKWVDGTSTTWLKNCEAVLRRAVQYLVNNAGEDGSKLYCMMAGDLFSQFKDTMSAKNRALVPLPEAVELGFPDTVNFEGMGLKSEWGTPSGQFNCFNFEKLELDILGEDVKELIVPIGPIVDPRTGDYLFRVRSLGNMKYDSPKYFAHGQAYA